MKKILRFLKRIWFLNFLRRIYNASKTYNKKYLEILKWGIRSNEDTNFTYFLTPGNMEYLVQTISVVTGQNRDVILNYMHEAEANMELKEHILSSVRNSRFKHVADPEIRFARRLGWYAFARIMKPQTIIETGVDKGLGSVLLCSALLKNKEEGYPGRYYGTDINPEAGYFLSGKYKEVGEILYGDSIETLTQFSQPIDLFINDSDHSAEYEYKEYVTIQHLLTDRAIILGDNSHCTDKLAQFSIKTNRHFLFFQEEPLKHWYRGAGIGISFKK